ncbi:MAG: hypothetical protein A2W91_02120 [Bacteroidetes bacterium GWF2_38_335]|nr:MAG: hypothetical protein A2W91_02120 [Bacteroidetes bacterium GWF2_38_335]OFY80649.1 MAG: hypothetical protein A2281_05135 [Bacteroidetes bacterium RIFOXYA12_FULL_38_20]HBS86990.1 hypothetical protein [Bacteroidales bacterium]
MKHIVFMLSAFFFIFTNAQSTLFIRHYTSPQTSYSLEDLSKINFSGSEMNVEKTGGEICVSPPIKDSIKIFSPSEGERYHVYITTDSIISFKSKGLTDSTVRYYIHIIDGKTTVTEVK